MQSVYTAAFTQGNTLKKPSFYSMLILFWGFLFCVFLTDTSGCTMRSIATPLGGFKRTMQSAYDQNDAVTKMKQVGQIWVLNHVQSNGKHVRSHTRRSWFYLECVKIWVRTGRFAFASWTYRLGICTYKRLQPTQSTTSFNHCTFGLVTLPLGSFSVAGQIVN